MKKILTLIYTILPGANRALFFLIASHTLIDIDFAYFSANYSLAIVLSMVGGAGIGTLIIKDNVSLDLIGIFKSSVTAMVISIPVLIAICLYNYSLIKPQILFLLSWSLTLNQIYRNEIILKKKFARGVFYESAIMITCSISLIVFSNDKAIYAVSFLYIALTFIIKLFEKNKSSPVIYNFLQASYISYSNLVSSGILFFFPSMSLALTTPNTTKIISILVSIIGVVSVFPRSVFNYKLTEFKSYLLAKDKANFNKYIILFRRVTSVLMLISTTFSLAYVSIILDLERLEVFKDVFVLVLLVSLYIYIGQLFIPETTLVNIIGYEKFSLTLNIINFLFFISTYFILKIIKVDGDFLPVYILSISVALGYFIRSFLIISKIKRYFKDESSLL